MDSRVHRPCDFATTVRIADTRLTSLGHSRICSDWKDLEGELLEASSPTPTVLHVLRLAEHIHCGLPTVSEVKLVRDGRQKQQNCRHAELVDDNTPRHKIKDTAVLVDKGSCWSSYSRVLANFSNVDLFWTDSAPPQSDITSLSSMSQALPFPPNAKGRGCS